MFLGLLGLEATRRYAAYCHSTSGGSTKEITTASPKTTAVKIRIVEFGAQLRKDSPSRSPWGRSAPPLPPSLPAFCQAGERGWGSTLTFYMKGDTDTLSPNFPNTSMYTIKVRVWREARRAFTLKRRYFLQARALKVLNGSFGFRVQSRGGPPPSGRSPQASHRDIRHRALVGAFPPADSSSVGLRRSCCGRATRIVFKGRER